MKELFTKENTSRRLFLKSSALGAFTTVIGSTIISCTNEGKNQTGKSASLPSAGGVVTRKDISQLRPDDASLIALKDAVGVLRKRSERMSLAPDGWFSYATLHNMFCFTNSYNRQVHFTWLFFPWHRGFLYFLEKRLQAAINEPSLALHYWDWTKYPKIPQAYWGKDNPLYDPTRLATEKDQIPDDYMNMASHLRTPHFKGFGGFPKISPKEPFGEGVVEQSVHNCIHNWIGGNMDNFATAAIDPIFYAHHGNIDRLWDAWLVQSAAHQNPIDERFLEYSYDFTDEYGTPTRIRTKDLLDTKKLGYQFESVDFTKTYEGANVRPTPAGDLACLIQDVNVDEGKRQEMAKALEGGYRRVILVMDRFKLPFIPICIRVFLGIKGKSMNETGPLSTQYVTTATILPVGVPDKAIVDENIIMQAEIEPHIAALMASGAQLQATLEPVKVPGRPLTATAVEIQQIAIRFDDEV